MHRKRIADLSAAVLDLFLCWFVIPSAYLLKAVRRLGLGRLKFTRAMLLRIGLLPVSSHYYEPFVRPRDLKGSLDEERDLPGIDLNYSAQLAFLDTLTFESELGDLTSPSLSPDDFRLGNKSFESGDAEFLYQVIRRIRPAKIVEIGSGYSTLMARRAVAKTSSENPEYSCRHICIEPYEAAWLEGLGVEVLRQRVENVDKSLFKSLGAGDLLFIDSSHIIRPQGDVLTEYLQILPILASGVMVHVHDVFTPRDYLEEWVKKSLLLWNEQYLLEAFLTHNTKWSIAAAVNMLKHRNFENLVRACPYLTADREPGSLYILKN